MWRRVTLCALLIGACGGPDSASNTSNTSTTSTASTASLPTELLTVKPLQYRDDIVVARLQLQVTNGLSRQLSLASVQLRWNGMDSALTELSAVLGIGQRVDLPVGLGTPRCEINGTAVSAPPPVADAEVIFTLIDDTTEVAEVRDPDGTLAAIHAASCEREMISQQFSLEFVDFALQRVDGRNVTVAVLRMQRGAVDGRAQVLSSGNTIPFNLMVGSDNLPPLLLLGTDATVVDAPVQFLEARCDSHAVAEAKQPFRFVMQVQLGDEAPRPYVVVPPAEMHAQMLSTAAAGCAVLGEDGSFDAGG